MHILFGLPLSDQVSQSVNGWAQGSGVLSVVFFPSRLSFVGSSVLLGVALADRGTFDLLHFCLECHLTSHKM